MSLDAGLQPDPTGVARCPGLWVCPNPAFSRTGLVLESVPSSFLAHTDGISLLLWVPSGWGVGSRPSHPPQCGFCYFCALPGTVISHPDSLALAEAFLCVHGSNRLFCKGTRPAESCSAVLLTSGLPTAFYLTRLYMQLSWVS